MRTLGIDYGDSRCGFAITDALNITVQGLETLETNGNDRVILKKIVAQNILNYLFYILIVLELWINSKIKNPNL